MASTQTQSTPYQGEGLRTDRSLGMYILLSIVTFGIYHLICFYNIGDDLNRIIGVADGRKTRNYVLVALLLSPITFGVMYFIWYHQMSNRVGQELRRRGIDFQLDASTYWLWSILGGFIIVGPFIYIHKLFTAMNLLSASYNANDTFHSPQNPFQ